jgi:LysM repeat protein
MENDSNIKPQPTGGLKLMTVFVVVIAAHVLVIGGFAIYHLIPGGSADADVLGDQTHKSVKVTPDGAIVNDGQSPDGTTADKTSTASTTDQTPDAGGTPAPVTVPASVATAPVSTSAPTAATPSGPVVSPATPPVSSPAPAAPTVASSPVVTPPATPMSVSSTTYTVKFHDSLAKIAHANRTSVAKLKAANGLTSNKLNVGQKLMIPARTQVAANPDSTGTTTNLSGSIPAPTTTAPVEAPEATHHVYTVVKGDTLTKIAHKFKTTTKALMSANSITDPAKLSIGTKLKIPSQESRSATTNQAPPAAQPSEVQAKPATSAQLANFVR